MISLFPDRRFLHFLLILIASLAFGYLARGQTELPERPNPPKLVNDLAALMDPASIQKLELKLRAYNDSTSTQIAIVIVPDLNGRDLADFAISLGQKWGIGSKQHDNGILILVAVNEKKTFIATGYGVEEKIPDIIAKRIIENQFKPEFSRGNFFKGLDEGTNEIISRLSGTYKASAVKPGRQPGFLKWLMILVIVLVILILISKKGGPGGGRTISHSGPIFWGGFLGGFGRGSGRGFGGGSGGFGGGGFGGFGGGNFGGGGAGGSW